MFANKLQAIPLGTADELYEALPDDEVIDISGAIEFLKAGEFASIETKTLTGPINELKVRQYRFLFCIENSTIYFLRGFIKKTMKTPRNEIKVAEKIHTMIMNKISKNISNV